MGRWTRPWVFGEWTEVHAVCGRAVGAVPNREGEGEARTGKPFILVLKVHPCLCWKMSLNFPFLTKQHLKKSKQTEEDMLYGTIVRTPTKRRFLGTTTPNKSRKVWNPCLRCINSLPLSFVVTSSGLLFLFFFNQFNATSSSSSTTSNSTMRCAFGGTVCRSPVPRLPLSAKKVCFIVLLTEDWCTSMDLESLVVVTWFL